MEERFIIELKKMTVDFFNKDDVKIILFGSRARKDNYTSSDVDIGIIPTEEFDEKKITLFKEKIENSNIPYKVYVINFKDVSLSLKEGALKEAVIWKD